MDKKKNQKCVYMETRGNSGFLMLILFILAIAGCVPAEEKIPAAFETSIRQESVRKIYEMQARQEKDSPLISLQSDDPSIRYAAARAFCSFQDSSALDALFPLLMDKQGQVRAMAAMARPFFKAFLARLENSTTTDYDPNAKFEMPVGGLDIETDCNKYNAMRHQGGVIDHFDPDKTYEEEFIEN